MRRASTTPRLRAKGFAAAGAGQGRRRARQAAFDLRFVFEQMDAQASRRLPERAQDHRPSAMTKPSFDLLSTLGYSQSPRSKAANIHVCGAMTLEGAPLSSSPSISGGVRLREPLRAHRQALSLGGEPYPHDGGFAAVHFGRDLEDHQHAQRSPASRIARTPICSPPKRSGLTGECALSRRLKETLAAPNSQLSSRMTTRRTSTRSRRSFRSNAPQRRQWRWRKAIVERTSSSASSASASASGCPIAARATSRRRSVGGHKVYLHHRRI